MWTCKLRPVVRRTKCAQTNFVRWLSVKSRFLLRTDASKFHHVQIASSLSCASERKSKIREIKWTLTKIDKGILYLNHHEWILDFAATFWHHGQIFGDSGAHPEKRGPTLPCRSSRQQRTKATETEMPLLVLLDAGIGDADGRSHSGSALFDSRAKCDTSSKSSWKLSNATKLPRRFTFGR